MGEQRRAPGRQVTVIANSYVSPPRPIDPRLDRPRGILAEDTVGRLGQPRGFMHLQTQPMTEAVDEFIAITAPLNVVAGNGVGIPPLPYGPDGPRGDRVRASEHIVNLALLGARPTHDHGTRE